MPTNDETEEKEKRWREEKERYEKRVILRLPWDDPTIIEPLENARIYRRIAQGIFADRPGTFTSTISGDPSGASYVQEISAGDYIESYRYGRFDFLPGKMFDMRYQPSNFVDGRFVTRECYKLTENPTGGYLALIDETGNLLQREISPEDIIGCKCDPETGSLVGNHIFSLYGMYLSPYYYEKQVET